MQKAVYEKLTSSSTLMTAISGVFDQVPQDTVFPFIVISDMQANNLSNLAKGGIEHRITLDIYSREAGKKQVADIMGILENLLHNNILAVTGQTCVTMEFISNSIHLENDGWTYQGIIELRVILYSN